MGCFVRGGKSGMGCFVRGDKNCMGCFVQGGKLMWDVLSGVLKNGMGCFVTGCWMFCPTFLLFACTKVRFSRVMALFSIYYCASCPLILYLGLFENNKNTRAWHTFVIRRYSNDL